MEVAVLLRCAKTCSRIHLKRVYWLVKMAPAKGIRKAYKARSGLMPIKAARIARADSVTRQRLRNLGDLFVCRALLGTDTALRSRICLPRLSTLI
jgi:hypothetical protein